MYREVSKKDEFKISVYEIDFICKKKYSLDFILKKMGAPLVVLIDSSAQYLDTPMEAGREIRTSLYYPLRKSTWTQDGLEKVYYTNCLVLYVDLIAREVVQYGKRQHNILFTYNDEGGVESELLNDPKNHYQSKTLDNASIKRYGAKLKPIEYR